MSGAAMVRISVRVMFGSLFFVPILPPPPTTRIGKNAQFSRFDWLKSPICITLAFSLLPCNSASNRNRALCLNLLRSCYTRCPSMKISPLDCQVPSGPGALYLIVIKLPPDNRAPSVARTLHWRLPPCTAGVGGDSKGTLLPGRHPIA